MQYTSSVPIPRDAGVEQSTARDLVYERIQDWITTGVLEPGEMITDAALAEALGVSRTPVREALQRLTNDRLVEPAPGRRIRVSQATAQDAELIYPAVAALQELAVKAAIPHLAPADLATLSSLNDKMIAAAETGEQEQAWRLDQDFHDVIIRRAENPYVAAALSMLQAHLRRVWILYFAEAVPARRSYEDHKRIVAALDAAIHGGDPDAAAKEVGANFLRALPLAAQGDRPAPARRPGPPA